MTEYQIQPHTRRCAVTGRELRPGERYYTALVAEGDKLLRKDFSSEGWPGPPPGVFGFWSGQVPAPDDAKRPRIDDDLLADCFNRLEGHEEQGRLNFRYVVALLLLRRKRFRFEEALAEGPREVLRLRCVRTNEVHEVVNPRLTADEMAAAQAEVFRVLGWE
jgi:hypothetical protein